MEPRAGLHSTAMNQKRLRVANMVPALFDDHLHRSSRSIFILKRHLFIPVPYPCALSLCPIPVGVLCLGTDNTKCLPFFPDSVFQTRFFRSTEAGLRVFFGHFWNSIRPVAPTSSAAEVERRQGRATIRVRLPLLPSGPGGVCPP